MTIIPTTPNKFHKSWGCWQLYVSTLCFVDGNENVGILQALGEYNTTWQ